MYSEYRAKNANQVLWFPFLERLRAFFGHRLKAGRGHVQHNVFNSTTQCEKSGEIRPLAGRGQVNPDHPIRRHDLTGPTPLLYQRREAVSICWI